MGYYVRLTYSKAETRNCVTPASLLRGSLEPSEQSLAPHRLRSSQPFGPRPLQLSELSLRQQPTLLVTESACSWTFPLCTHPS